jgi:hypothetical protein
MDSFCTHAPFLEYYLNRTKGDVLELGTGYGSTPIITKMLKNSNRNFVSVDNDLEWLEKIKHEYPESDTHTYIYTDNWKDTISTLVTRKWGLVFIDQKPWDARTLSLYAFRNISDYVIIHDVDYFPKNNIFGKYISEFDFNFDTEFKNWALYYPNKPWPYVTGPPTLVGTNFEKHIEDERYILKNINSLLLHTSIPF